MEKSSFHIIVKKKIKKFTSPNGNPHQYSCLENSMDRGAWQAIVHGAAESDTIKRVCACARVCTHTHTHTHTHTRLKKKKWSDK